MIDVFERVVCGVDRSDAGETAAQVAARVTDPGGSLVLLSVDDPSIAVHAGWRMAAVAEQLARDARVALERGRAEAAPMHAVDMKVVEGDPLHCLLAEIERRDATLAVVGTHGISRAVGIALGSVTTHLLHEAPCSVLVARAPGDPQRWPRSIVVGVDGSRESEAALAVARELAGRFGASVQAVAATGDSHIDLEAAPHRARALGAAGACRGRAARPLRGGRRRRPREPRPEGPRRAGKRRRTRGTRSPLLGARRTIRGIGRRAREEAPWPGR